MPDDDDVIDLVDRIVAAARVPGRAARDDLRRELLAHFDEAGADCGEARQRFGEEAVTRLFRRVYLREYLAAYAVKVAASIAVAAAVALAIEAVVNLRVATVGQPWRLAPSFPSAALLGTMIAVGIAIAREATRRPLTLWRGAGAAAAYAAVFAVAAFMSAHSRLLLWTAPALVAAGWLCSKVEWRFSRLVLVFATFAATEYALHQALSVEFGPTRALWAAAILTIVWGATIIVLARLDRAFARWFDFA